MTKVFKPPPLVKRGKNLSNEEVTQCAGQFLCLCLFYGVIVCIVSYSESKQENVKPNE